jgi:hypothetical protein
LVDIAVLALVFAIPLAVVAVSAELKRPLSSEVEDSGEYRNRMTVAKNEWGLDLYLGGLTVLISSTIFVFSGSVPIDNYTAVVLYLIAFGELSRLYQTYWPKRNWCLWFSAFVAGCAIAYSLYLLLAHP